MPRDERAERPAAQPIGANAIIRDMMNSISRKGIPAPDETLKSIVGAQIRGLIKGGYNPERIHHFAIELALSWDNAKGHQRMLGLRQAVLQDVADREYAEHERIKRESNEAPADPKVAIAILNAAKRRMRGEEPRSGWSVPCSAAGCPRTSLYASTACSDHQRERVSA